MTTSTDLARRLLIGVATIAALAAPTAAQASSRAGVAPVSHAQQKLAFDIPDNWRSTRSVDGGVLFPGSYRREAPVDDGAGSCTIQLDVSAAAVKQGPTVSGRTVRLAKPSSFLTDGKLRIAWSATNARLRAWRAPTSTLEIATMEAGENERLPGLAALKGAKTVVAVADLTGKAVTKTTKRDGSEILGPATEKGVEECDALVRREGVRAQQVALKSMQLRPS